MVFFSRKLFGFGGNTEPGFVSLHASRGHGTIVANFSTHLCQHSSELSGCVSSGELPPVLPHRLLSGEKPREIICLLFYFFPLKLSALESFFH